MSTRARYWLAGVAYLLIGVVAALALTYSYYSARNHIARGDSDFFCYYEAGKGNLDFMHPTGHVPYLYHPITAKGFAWMPTMTPYTAFLWWYWLMVGCWVVMTYHLMKIRGGWIVFFFTIPALQLNLEYCQVSPMLATLAFHPIGAWVAIWYKPYYALHCIAWSLVIWKRSNETAVLYLAFVATAVVLHHPTEDTIPVATAIEWLWINKTTWVHFIPIYYILHRYIPKEW